MPEIQSPDPGRKLQERYNLIGPPAAPFLSPELVPVVLIDDLTEEAPGLLFAMAAGVVGPTVGVQSQTALTNGSGNFLIADIRLHFAADTLSDWGMFTAGPALSSAATELWQARARAGTPQAVVTEGTDAGATGVDFVRGRGLADTIQEIAFPNLVLAFGDKAHFLYGGNNIALAYWWTWSERTL